MRVVGNSELHRTAGTIISKDNLPVQTIEIILQGPVHQLQHILSSPMTRNRTLEQLFTLCADFQNDISMLPNHASVGDFGCGTGEAACGLIEKKLGYKIIAVDQQSPSENLRDSVYLRFVKGNLESNITRESIADNSLDYVYSFFTSMYLKDPFAFLSEIQQKLGDGGHALVHLGYEEQYAGGLEFIMKQLHKLDTSQLRVGNELCTELLHQYDDDAIYIGNASAMLQPIFVRFGKEDDLSTIQSITSTPGMYIDYAGSTYKLRYSDQRYMYSPIPKNTSTEK